MATQVEVSAALPPLTSRSELTNEPKLQHAFALSDASHKPGELPGSLSPLVLEERGTFGNPLRPATTMPPAASRPRLTPRPFFRGKSSDTFAAVRPPVPALKPGNAASKSPTFAKTFEDVTVARRLPGNIPPLVDQKLIENKSTGELVANMLFDSSPQANTVILFETGKPEKSRVKFAPEKSHLGSPPLYSPPQAPEGQPPLSEPEGFRRTAGFHRQLSLSSEARPVSWNPSISLERQDYFPGASEEKGTVLERQHSTGIRLADEVQLRPKQRPMSAIFLESLKDPKHSCSAVSGEKSLPEKTWGRKPRPLSMDLTAKFENRDLSLQRKSCPDENLSPDPTIQGSVRPSERGTESEAMVSEKADTSKSALKSPGPFASFTSILNQKPFPSEVAPSCQSTQKDLAQVSARDRKCLWESRLKRQDEQNASDTEIRTTSEKDTEPSGVRGQAIKDRAVLSQTEPPATRKNCTNVSDTENQSLRHVEKPMNVLDRLANDATSVSVDRQLESPEKEHRIMNIQQRIKELTAENAETKPGNLRRSFRSRPLSADLTKLFSSPVATSELKSEKLAEVNRKPANEPQEIQEIKINPLCGTNSEEAHAGGVLWKPHQPVRILPTQRDGREKHSVTLPGDSPASVADHDTPAGKACIKTVRATVFEHNVQRHTVAADHFVAEPPSQLMHELVGNYRESWRGKAAETTLHVSKEVPCRQLDMWVDAEKPGKAHYLNEDRVLQDAAWKKYTTAEKCENPTYVEDSLVFQRVEPRYEILQTVGKRAQSEAVAIVCEEKAVTLRSRRSLKERRKPGENRAGASWSCSLDVEGECSKEDGFVSKHKEAGERAEKADTLQTLNASHDQHAFQKPVTEVDKRHTGEKQQGAGTASHFTSRNKDLGTADDRVPTVSSELEKEKGKGMKAASKMPKRFPENFGAGSGGMDGGDAGASIGQNSAAGNTSKLESPLSVSGGSPWQAVGSKAPHPSADRRTYEAEGPTVFGLRKCLTAPCTPDTPDAAGPAPGGGPFKQAVAEEELKRSRPRASAAKGSERWRRKTLPHDIRFDEAGPLAEEGAKMLIRRDSLQFHEGSIAERSTKPRCVVEPKEGTVVPPSSPEDHFRDQHSPLKPKVTYFAVTYQIPNEAEGPSGKEFAPKSKQTSSQAENPFFALNASTAGRPPPGSDHQSCAAILDTQTSLDRHPGKNREAAEGGDASDPVKKGAFAYPGSDRREETWRPPRSQAEGAQERLLGAEAPLQSVTASSPCDLKPPSYLRYLPQNGEHVSQKKHSDYSCGVAKEKNTDSYRSRVLDIDALMAEYREDSLRPSVIPDRREGEGSSWFPWEKDTRNPSDKTPVSYNRREPQALNASPGSPWQDISTVEVHGSETTVCVSGRGRPQNCSSEQHAFKPRDEKCSPPPWGRPSALCSPAGAAGTKKKTFILDEEPGASLELWCQGAKRGGHEGQAPGPAGFGLKAEASFVPPPSSVLADSILWKGTCPRQPATNASLPGDWPDTSSLSKRKSSIAGSSQKGGSSALQSQPECNTSALSNAPPDFKRCFSEKTHQARVRGSLPVGPEARERQDQHEARQSFPPERADRRQNRRSTSQQRCLFGDEKKDVEKERSGRVPESPGARSPSCLPLQRRSRSFYRDRTVDHWAVDQLKQCFGRPVAEAKDTDTLVREADSQYGTWREQRHSGDSLVPESPSSESNVASARKQPTSSRLSSFSSQTDPASVTDQHDSSRDQRSASLDRSSTDRDSADGAEGPAQACPEFSFLEHTTVLDSSALKTRVQLSRRRRQHRAPVSHLLRRSNGGEAQPRLSVTEEAGSAWMFKDSTAPEEKSARPEDSEEEEGKLRPPSDWLPVSQPQRLQMFPGLDHSALKAELRRRQEPEGTREVSPVHVSKSPKSTFPAGGLGARMLPTGVEKEERLEEAPLSPQWLKELKSKKRQSQYENQV